MTDYSIAAIPTMYRGRRYRSRLEARWAAFFDLLGWRHEYEPGDLGTWSPDFAIQGDTARPPVLVEVKPFANWHRATARKMADAVEGSGPGVLLLLVGNMPDFADGWSQDAIGWIGRTGMFECLWGNAFIGKTPEARFDLDAPDDEPYGRTVLWGEPRISCPECTVGLWKAAANAVQWKPRR